MLLLHWIFESAPRFLCMQSGRNTEFHRVFMVSIRGVHRGKRFALNSRGDGRMKIALVPLLLIYWPFMQLVYNMQPVVNLPFAKAINPVNSRQKYF